jgi:mycothiol synthase
MSHRRSVHLAVTPGSRRRGLGRLLAVTALHDADPSSAWSHGDHPGAAALAEEFGLRRDRELWLMRRDTGSLPEAAELPGVTIRGYHDADEAALLKVNAAAFAGHEQGLLDAAELAERMAEPWFDPRDLLVAVDPHGTMLGFHWTKRHSPERGEVYVVAVAPETQGTGLGKALTSAGLRHLATPSTREIVLYVEAHHDVARRLYERLGFAHRAADTHVAYAVQPG